MHPEIITDCLWNKCYFLLSHFTKEMSLTESLCDLSNRTEPAFGGPDGILDQIQSSLLTQGSNCVQLWSNQWLVQLCFFTIIPLCSGAWEQTSCTLAKIPFWNQVLGSSLDVLRIVLATSYQPHNISSSGSLQHSIIGDCIILGRECTETKASLALTVGMLSLQKGKGSSVPKWQRKQIKCS